MTLPPRPTGAQPRQGGTPPRPQPQPQSQPKPAKPSPAAIAARFAEAVAHHQAGRLTEAERFFRQILSVDPRHADSLYRMGVLASQAGQFEDAIKRISAAITINPGASNYHFNLGNAQAQVDRLEDAVISFRRALALRADYVEALNNLGNALQELGRHNEAVTAFAQAAALRPDSAPAQYNLGNLLKELGQFDDAALAYRSALRLQPDYADAHNNLGNTLMSLGQIDEARNSFNTALDLKPGSDIARKGLIACKLLREDPTGGPPEFRRNYPHLFIRDVPAWRVTATSPGRKLRVGYLSSDLRRHPVARNLMPVIRAHDRENFEVHFYTAVRRPDAVTAEFRALADGWHDIRAVGDEHAAELIRADGIDILVSLAGGFDDNRPQICAHRAAPIQISLFDASSSGIPEMDYIIGDRWVIPGRSSESFTERPLLLPNLFVTDPPRELPEIGTAPTNGTPVFGCFNNPAKITPSALLLWGRILAAVPEGRLLLKYANAYGSESVRERFLRHLGDAGIHRMRVTFLTSAESEHTHLAHYDKVDVALDTFPFSGMTTTFEALSMGVPVVTLPGRRMVSRWTMGILQGLGHQELIADSPDRYVSIAVGIARKRAVWRARRRKFREGVLSSSLCDGALWTKRLERLYRAVWRQQAAQAQEKVA